MALANNQREQLAKRLKADIELRELGYTVTQSVATTGEPLLFVYSGATVIAVFSVSRRTFAGFNVVAELSSSAAEGLPESITWAALDNSLSQTVTSRLVFASSKLGTSSMKLVFTAGAPTAASVLNDSLVSAELPNDARCGASGQ